MADTEISIEIPEPRESLINATREGLPEVLVANRALLSFAHTEVFGWHLLVSVEAVDLIESGMPSLAESEVLFDVCDEIEAGVLGTLTDRGSVNALLLARGTWNGTRELAFYVHDPEIVNDALQALLKSRKWTRDWSYHMKEDFDWEEAGYIFKLFAPERLHS